MVYNLTDHPMGPRFDRIHAWRIPICVPHSRAYSLSLEFLHKDIRLASTTNAHHLSDSHEGLMQISMNGRYAERAVGGLALEHAVGAQYGDGFLCMLKRLARSVSKTTLGEDGERGLHGHTVFLILSIFLPTSGCSRRCRRQRSRVSTRMKGPDSGTHPSRRSP